MNNPSFTWTYSRAMDMIRYFLGSNYSLAMRTSLCFALFDRTEMVAFNTNLKELLKSSGAWPDPKMFPPRERRIFIAHDCSVMFENENVANARSHTMAKRIAHALNYYTPGRRGR